MARKRKPAVRKEKTAKASAGNRGDSARIESGSEPTRSTKSPPERNSAGTLTIKHESHYRGDDWWNWSVWVEGPENKLNKVEYVEYTLHPAFPEPVTRRADRDTKFRLDSAGWGEFMIGVEIKQKEGSRLKRQHWLTLEYPSRTPSSRSSQKEHHDERPTIYLSGSLADLSLSTPLGEALENHGFEVLDNRNLPGGVPWDKAFTDLIKQAELLVVLISGGLNSWAMREIDIAIKCNVPIIPIVIGRAVLPISLQSFQRIALKDVGDPPKIAPQVAQQIWESVHH